MFVDPKKKLDFETGNVGGSIVQQVDDSREDVKNWQLLLLMVKS